MIVYAYMSGGDIVALFSDVEKLTAFAESRSDGDILAADWVRHFDGAWSPMAGAFRRPYWSNPFTEAVIMEIGNFGGEVQL